MPPIIAEKGVRFSPGDLLACPGCQKASRMGGYVAAHWHVPLVHRCHQCRIEIRIQSGEVTDVLWLRERGHATRG